MPKISVENVFIPTNYPRKDVGSVDSLARSIEQYGLAHPIVVDANTGELIAGLRRLRACEKLGWDVIPCTQVDPKGDAMGLTLAENNERKDWSLEDKVAIARHYEEKIGDRRLSKGKGSEVLNLTLRPGEKTRDAIARLADFGSWRICELGKLVFDHAIPEVVAMIDAEEATISDAASIAELPHDLQRQAAELLRSGTVRTLGAAARAIDPELMPDTKPAATALVESPEDRTTPADAEMEAVGPEEEEFPDEEEADPDQENDHGDPVGSTNGTAPASGTTPKPPRPTEPKSATQDKNGEPWPERAKPAVELMPELRKLGDHLRGCAEELRRLKSTPIGTFIDVDSTAGKIERSKNDAFGALPYAVCPYCQGEGTKTGEAGLSLCEGCKGGGWVTRNRYQNSPRHTEEMKAAGKL